MRRTVAGIALAVVLFCPARGMAATEHSGRARVISWWNVVVTWTARLFGEETAKDISTPSLDDGGGGGDTIDEGTTTDANGRA